MDLRIRGKWALVTGGASGIGEEISCQLAAEGVNLLVTSRTTEPINRLVDKLAPLPVSVRGVEVDFLHADSHRTLADAIVDVPIDILVNNAGHNLKITDPYCPIEDWHRVMDLNFFTAVRLCNLLIPRMKSQGWGRIVNITSCAGLENMGPVTYGVAKSSLTVYTRTMGRILATEAGAVVMTAVFPGVVLTEGGHWDLVLRDNPAHAEQYLKDRCPLGRFGLPSEIAPVVAFYCSELASFSHGAIVPVDAGQSRHYMSFNYMT